MGFVMNLVTLIVGLLWAVCWVIFTLTGNAYFAIHGIIFAVMFTAGQINGRLKEIEEMQQQRFERERLKSY